MSQLILGSVDYILEAHFHPFLPFSKQSPVSSTISEVLVTAPIHLDKDVKKGSMVSRKVHDDQNNPTKQPYLASSNSPAQSVRSVNQHKSSPSSFYKIIQIFCGSKEFRLINSTWVEVLRYVTLEFFEGIESAWIG